MTMTRKMMVAMLLALALPAQAQIIDGFAFEAGASSSTDMFSVAVQKQWSKRWLQGDAWHLGGYWEFSLAQWNREALPGERDQLVEIGITPVFRIQRNSLRGLYVEGGIGAHLLSSTELGNKRFGSSFQFGDHLGLGYRFGANKALDIGYRYQHLSNVGIKDPNQGIDFHQIRLQYWY